VLLRRMQSLLTGLYDAPVEHDAEDFLVSDPERLRDMVGEPCSDEQVFVVEQDGEVRIGLFIDQRVLDRLRQRDPLDELNEDNLHDFCTALEGVSHFHYLIWSCARGRSVSLLELELQAEVDKYATALALLTKQRAGAFPGDLHARMFDSVSFLPELDEISRRRYQVANRNAARYCRSLDQRYLHPRRRQPEKWLAELRRFFRCGHQEKIRQLALGLV
jgi:hypothetical protein